MKNTLLAACLFLLFCGCGNEPAPDKKEETKPQAAPQSRVSPFNTNPAHDGRNLKKWSDDARDMTKGIGK